MSEVKPLLINGRITRENVDAERRKVGEAVRLCIRSDGTWMTTQVVAVSADGTEYPVMGCERIDIAITWEGAVATVRIQDVELAVEAKPAAPKPEGVVNVTVNVSGAPDADEFSRAVSEAIEAFAKTAA